MKKTTLIIGGARSGKSKYAEDLCEAIENKFYIATAENRDDEMNNRIKQHQQRRDHSWQTLEHPLSISRAITNISQNETLKNHNAIILIDCLTLWLSNLMAAEKNIASETEKLIKTIENTAIPLILISNEVGLSIVPENALARAFRDEQGLLNQNLAKVVPNVVFMAAGLPLFLKQS